MKYVCLMRGINVGGKNKISMAELRTCLEKDGFKNVATYINSGNVILESDEEMASKVERVIEQLLLQSFKFDSELIKISALTKKQLETIIKKAPKGFGQEPDKYHNDVLFPMGIASSEIMKITEINPEVDAAWEANGVVYYRRLSARRTSSRLGKIVMRPVYKSITIRSWNTTIRLLQLINQ